MQKLSLLVVVLILCTGCAALLNGSTESVDLTTDPPGAQVFVDGMPHGVTPAEVDLSVQQSHKVEFRMDGYHSDGTLIGYGVGGVWVILDIICGLFPIIIDAATGAWYNLDTNAVHITLRPVQ